MARLIPNTTLSEWLKIYDLVIADEPCSKCGKNFQSTIPFAEGKWMRGLMAPLHECGENYRMYTVIHLRDRQKMKDALKLLMEDLSNEEKQ